MSLRSRRLSITDRDYAAEHDSIEELFGLSDEPREDMTACVDCGAHWPVNQLFWTPSGNRCRSCYQAKYGRSR